MLEDLTPSRRKSPAAILLALWLPVAAIAGLAERIEKVADPKKHEDYSIHIVHPDSDAIIYTRDARKPLIPASNMKLVTTAAAVHYLGGDFVYRTQVGLFGETLVVIGSGDPLFGDDVTDRRHGREEGYILERIEERLREEGVSEISDIVVDSTVFDDERVHPSWPARDHNKWYACEVSGLNYNTNCIEVIASKVGNSVAVMLDPPTTFVEILNEVEPISVGQGAVGSNRTVQPNRITVFGKVKERQGPFRVAIEQPAAFFGFVLAEHLVRAGIGAKGKLIEGAFDNRDELQVIHEFTTPLADVLWRSNTDSLGLAAEALVKTIDAHGRRDRRNGGWAGGRERIGEYLEGLGIGPEEFRIDDGSGLSRENRLTTRAIAKILFDLYHSQDWEMFRASLAVGGEEGTIDRYFNESKYRGRIHGKTGYIRGVRSFSGVCLTKNGPYIFSVISNGPKGLSRDAINGVARAIIDEYGGAERESSDGQDDS
jgi:D-alanyl-D-alanine carboxypeptidase/D-alanyl-D-alanine-endopeptidase (penicillin-binding protein 4)